MAKFARSNRSLSRFWGSIVAITCCGLVLAAALSLPAHKSDKPALSATADGPTQTAGAPHPAGDASASATMVAPSVVPEAGNANAQPNPTLSAGTARSQTQAITEFQQAPITVAAKPLSTAMSPWISTDELPHRCSGGQSTWSTCIAHPRRIAWRHGRRSCIINIAGLCLRAF